MKKSRPWLALGVSAVLLSGMDDPPPTSKPSPRSAKNARKGVARDRDVPPACGTASKAAVQPPAQSMPQLFDRMMDNFARNPASGFNSFLGELANLEGPALEGVTLTRDEERQAGLKAKAEYLDQAARRGFQLVNDPKKVGYFRALVDRFSGRMAHRDRYPAIEVTLIDAPIPDGQSFPGGFLLFTTGLLDEPDEATVAGVVAHELAHLNRGHLYNYARRSKLAEATYRNPPGGNGDFNQFFTREAALLGLMMNPFRPEHELEADCTSATWLFLEGYDPKGLVGFFERMNQRNNDQPANPFFTFGRTHPYSLDRKRAVLDRLAQLQRWKRRDDLGLYADNLRKLEPRPRE
jgi:beta-barrel assembly-enhancing protease